MRIVIWSPNYAPELTGIAPLVTDAAEWLTARGHTVEVATPMPNYPERRIYESYRGRLWMTEHRSGVLVHRSWLRVRSEERFLDKALYELTSSTMALPNVLRRLRRHDVVLCVVPSLLAATFATILPRHPRVVLWVQDLVVRAADSVEARGPARMILAAAAAIERWTVGRADSVVVCSPGFRDHFARNGVDPSRIEILYNWADLDWIAPSSTDAGNGRTHFLYSGNLGYTQGVETLVEAARIAGEAVTVDIVGDGNAAREVARFAEEVANVTVRPPVPRDEFPGLLAAHDAHVVVQRRISAGANFPSKIATYLASGRPIVASIDESTPAAEMLRESGGAIVVGPESPSALAEAMLHLGGRPDLRRELGERSRAFAESRFGKDAALLQLEEVLLR